MAKETAVQRWYCRIIAVTFSALSMKGGGLTLTERLGLPRVMNFAVTSTAWILMGLQEVTCLLVKGDCILEQEKHSTLVRVGEVKLVHEI